MGGDGDDRLIGGGGNDVFRLELGGDKDTIQGFAAHGYSGSERDHIDLSLLGIHKADFASEVHISNTSEGALISAGDTQVVVLGMSASSFNSMDFLFA